MTGSGFNKSVTIPKDQTHGVEFRPLPAVVLAPALGYPAMVRRRADGSAWLEMMILTKKNQISPAEVAFHVRLVPWRVKDQPTRYTSKRLNIFQSYFMKTESPVPVDHLVRVSQCYPWKEDSFGLGQDGCDHSDTAFELKLSQSNVYDWVMKSYRDKGYRHIFKIALNLAYEPLADNALYNVMWLETEAVQALSDKPSLAKALRNYLKSMLPDVVCSDDNKPGGSLKMQLSEFKGGVDPDSAENIRVSIYGPVYKSSKREFNIGHVTDVHLDTRMDVYAQSEASVIEVKANCGENLRFDGKGRVVANGDLHVPLKKKVANFNGYFKDICKGLFDKGADCLVVTGDLVDYNRGLHSVQTFRKGPEKPSKTWASLNKAASEHKKDRNWFLFYQVLLSLYDGSKKPIFTLLGNHDYVKFAMAPWPTLGLSWEGVYDQNLTRYESSLMFGRHDYMEIFGHGIGPGYNSPFEFFADGMEHTSCVQWYSYFINPFADYVVTLGTQSLFMVDWGCKADIFKSIAKGSEALHHAKHVFKDKMDFGVMVGTEDGTRYEKHGWPYDEPFPIRNYSIYKAWIESKKKKTIRILFMHPTAICPLDTVSDGELVHAHTWKDRPLQFGSFNGRRDEILTDVEQGRLHIVVTGHSHRNLIMEVKSSHPDRVALLGSGERMDTGTIDARHIVMVTSSAGPIPKYLPGAPLICGCHPKHHDRYQTGYFYDAKAKRLSTLDSKNRVVDTGRATCPICGMHGNAMAKKPPARHKPGGNLLTFTHGSVKIETVVVRDTLDLPSKPRKGPLCEKWGVMTEEMVLDGVKNKQDFADLKSRNLMNISSRFPFTRYNHMVFPTSVKYANFEFGDLATLVDHSSVDKVRVLPENPKEFTKRVSQTVVKDSFDTLMQSAKSNQSMAFMRYLFEGNEAWDREIEITKI